MKTSKRLLSLILAVMLIVTVIGVPAGAVTIREISPTEKYFPEGIPEYLTEEQIQTVLAGEYLQIEVDDRLVTYNPENKPSLTRATYNWREDLTINHTWWPSYCKYEYATGSTASNKYFISNQDGATPLGSLRGRSWVSLTDKKYNSTQGQNEEVKKPLITGSYYIFKEIGFPSTNGILRVEYSSRNLVTDWVQKHIITNSK